MCPAVAGRLRGPAGRGASRAPSQTSTASSHSVLLAQSTDRDRNLQASSGGLIKELLLHYLAQPDVDGVIALGHVGGLDFQPTPRHRAR